jgi:hypothetical protein
MNKTIINYYEQERQVGNLKVIYKGGIVKENLMSSIITDTYTFGILLLSFWVNSQFIHSKIVSCILLFCFLFTLNSAKKKRISKEEFKKIMNEYLEECEK